MKKFWIIGIAVVVLAIIGVVLFLIFGGGADKTELLNCTTRGQVQAFFDEAKAENGYINDAQCYMENVELFGRKATVDVSFNGDLVSDLQVNWILHHLDFSEDETAQTFGESDRKIVSEEFENLRKEFSKYLGAELVQYDLAPAYMDAPLEDSDEQFFLGNHLREYSVRDRSGNLWILEMSASYGMAVARLRKVVDESGYVGFIPALDLTK